MARKPICIVRDADYMVREGIYIVRDGACGGRNAGRGVRDAVRARRDVAGQDRREARLLRTIWVLGWFGPSARSMIERARR